LKDTKLNNNPAVKDITLKLKFTQKQWEAVDRLAMPSGLKPKTKRLMYVLKSLINKELSGK
jgi:hypothetical protein